MSRAGLRHAGLPTDERSTSRRFDQPQAELDERRVQTSPLDAVARMELAQGLSMMATGWDMTGDLSTAVEFAERSVEIRRALWEADPNDHRVRDRFAYALTLLGQLRRKRGDWRGALTCLREAVDHAEALARGTNFYMAWHNLAWAHLERAEVYQRLGSSDFCTEYRQAAEAYRRLLVHRREYYAGKLSQVHTKLDTCDAAVSR